MAAMSLTDLRAYVRTFLDTDAVDLPDELLAVFAAEAIDNIARSSTHWRFYEAEYPFSSVVGQGEYAFRDSGNPIATTLSEISGVQGPTFALRQIGHSDARRKYQATIASNGVSREWSVWGDSLWLWPTPATIEAYTIVGYRLPVAISSAASLPDLPTEFHPLVAKWMLALAYQQQDDTYSSQLLMSEASQGVQSLRRRYETVQTGAPAVMGGSAPADLGRLLYDFEV